MGFISPSAGFLGDNLMICGGTVASLQLHLSGFIRSSCKIRFIFENLNCTFTQTLTYVFSHTPGLTGENQIFVTLFLFSLPVNRLTRRACFCVTFTTVFLHLHYQQQQRQSHKHDHFCSVLKCASTVKHVALQVFLPGLILRALLLSSTQC